MIALVILLLTVIGWPIGRLLDPRARGGRAIGQSFLLGAAASALLLFLLTALHVLWSPTRLVGGLVVLAAAALFASRARRAKVFASTSDRGASPLDLLWLVVVIAHLVIAGGEAPYEYDFFGIWGFKARLFYEMRAIDWSALVSERYFWIQQGHPLFVSLFYDVVALLRHEWSDTDLGLLTTAFGVATVFIVRGHALDETGSRRRAAFVALAIAPLALSLWVGLAEGFLIAFATAGLLLLRRGVQLSSTADVRVGAIFLGCAVMTKNEGMGFLAATAGALLISRRRGWRDVLQLWPALVVAAPWVIARRALHLGADFLAGNFMVRFAARLRDPLPLVRTLAANFPTDRLMWIVALVTVIVFWRVSLRRERFLVLALGVLFSLYVAQNFVVPWDPVAHIRFSFGRILDQIAPATAYLAAMLLLRTDGTSECDEVKPLEV